MTALRKYERLEAIGHWRATPDAPLREVVVSFGNSTLNLTSLRDEPLEHWALAALIKLAAQDEGVLYATDIDAEETLLITDPMMIEAIDSVTAALFGHKKQRGLPVWRILIAAVLIVALGAGSTQVPNLLRQKIVEQTSPIRARALSEKLMALLGRECVTPEAGLALNILTQRLQLSQTAHPIKVIDGAGPNLLTLPDGTYVVGRAALERLQTPEGLAAEIAMAQAQITTHSPMLQLMQGLDIWQVLGFLLRGWPDDAALLKALYSSPLPTNKAAAAVILQNAQISLSGLGMADEAVLRPALDDQSWVALQGVCDF
jgi:hypothetical protein